MNSDSENTLIRAIQNIVDDACCRIGRYGISASEAEKIILETRSKVLNLLPDKGDTFELLYASRLRRIAEQFGGVILSD